MLSSLLTQSCHCEDPSTNGDEAIPIIEIATPHLRSARNDKVN